MFADLSPVHLIIVLVIVVLFIGPGKLPETGAGLGKALHDLRQGMSEPVAGGGPGTTTPAATVAATAALPETSSSTSDGAAT